MQIQGLTTISVRDFLRGYKATMAKVVASGLPTVVTSRQKPRVAVIDMNSLTKLRDGEELKYTRNFIQMGEEARKINQKYKITGPKDLSANLDKYTWGGK